MYGFRKFVKILCVFIVGVWLKFILFFLEFVFGEVVNKVGRGFFFEFVFDVINCFVFVCVVVIIKIVDLNVVVVDFRFFVFLYFGIG